MTSSLSDDFLILFNPMSRTVLHCIPHTHTHIGTNVRDNVKAVLKLQAAAEKAKKVRTYVCMYVCTSVCLDTHMHGVYLLLLIWTSTPLPCHSLLFYETHAISSSVWFFRVSVSSSSLSTLNLPFALLCSLLPPYLPPFLPTFLAHWLPPSLPAVT